MCFLRDIVSASVYSKRKEWNLKECYSEEILRKAKSRLKELPYGNAVQILRQCGIKSIRFVELKTTNTKQEALLIPIIDGFMVAIDRNHPIDLTAFLIGHELAHTFEYRPCFDGNNRLVNVLYSRPWSLDTKRVEEREDVCDLFSAIWLSQIHMKEKLIRSLTAFQSRT